MAIASITNKNNPIPMTEKIRRQAWLRVFDYHGSQFKCAKASQSSQAQISRCYNDTQCTMLNLITRVASVSQRVATFDELAPRWISTFRELLQPPLWQERQLPIHELQPQHPIDRTPYPPEELSAALPPLHQT